MGPEDVSISSMSKPFRSGLSWRTLKDEYSLILLCEAFSFLSEDPEEDRDSLSDIRIVGISATRDFFPVMYILGSITREEETEPRASVKAFDIHLRCSEKASASLPPPTKQALKIDIPVSRIAQMKTIRLTADEPVWELILDVTDSVKKTM